MRRYPASERAVRTVASACVFAVIAAGAQAATAEAIAALPWWRSPGTLSLVAIGLALVGLAAMVVRWLAGEPRQTASRGRQDGRAAIEELNEALHRVEGDARLAWRMLKDEAVIDGYILWDREQRLADYSGIVVRYIPQLAELERPSARQVIECLVDSGNLVLPPDDDRDSAIEYLCRVRNESPGLREMRMSDGQVFIGRTVDLGEGRTASIFTNITALKRHEQARGTSEALFRTAFESGPSMMVLLDDDQRPLAINRAFRTTLGYTLEAFSTLGWGGILHPDDTAEHAANSAPWMPAVKRLIAADGSVLRGEIRFTPVRDASGRREGRMLVTIEDLTARWETEERARFQASLLDQVSNAVLAVDRQGRILYGNRAAQTLFQWSEKVMMGVPVDRLLGSEVLTAIAGDAVELESDGRTWSGGSFPAAITIARTADETGAPGGAVLVVTDLTQRRALDLQLMHSARLATLGEMAASIAHEFNQCLHVIRLASEALRLDVTDGRMEIDRFTRRADNILAQVDRLTDMVMQMRTISRRDAQGKQTFQVQQALDAALRMVEPLLQADGVKVVRHGSLGDLTVMGHQVRLEQVLLNMLNNARDAIHERVRRDGGGGGTVTVRCAIDTADSRLTIAVRDDGTGVPEEVGHHIFEPFVTTKDGSRGCGLGLSISRGICTEMGGNLSYRNVDKGAEFVVNLPYSGGQAPTEVEDTAAPPPDGDQSLAPEPGEDDECLTGQRRLLLVDDEALSVMMVCEFLERQGYTVDTAYDGVEALALCGQHVYDAVITDIRMPRMDGRALIKHLAELQPGTPVIVVTGHLRQGSASELGGNVRAILPKPFQLLHLREQLNHLEAAQPAALHQLVEED